MRLRCILHESPSQILIMTEYKTIVWLVVTYLNNFTLTIFLFKFETKYCFFILYCTFQPSALVSQRICTTKKIITCASGGLLLNFNIPRFRVPLQNGNKITSNLKILLTNIPSRLTC